MTAEMNGHKQLNSVLQLFNELQLQLQLQLQLSQIYVRPKLTYS